MPVALGDVQGARYSGLRTEKVYLQLGAERARFHVVVVEIEALVLARRSGQWRRHGLRRRRRSPSRTRGRGWRTGGDTRLLVCHIMDRWSSSSISRARPVPWDLRTSARALCHAKCLVPVKTHCTRVQP